MNECIFKDKEIGSVYRREETGQYTINLFDNEGPFHVSKYAPTHKVMESILKPGATKESIIKDCAPYAKRRHTGELRFTNDTTLTWGRQVDGTEITFSTVINAPHDKVLDELCLEFPIFKEEYCKDNYPKIVELKNPVKLLLKENHGVRVRCSKSKKQDEHQTNLEILIENSNLKKENNDLKEEIDNLKDENNVLKEEKESLVNALKDIRSELSLANAYLNYVESSPRTLSIKSKKCQRCGYDMGLRTNWKGDSNHKGEIFYSCTNYTYNGISCKNSMPIDYDVYWENRDEIEAYLKEDLIVYWDSNKKEKDKRVLYETDCIHEVIERKLPYPNSYYGR